MLELRGFDVSNYKTFGPISMDENNSLAPIKVENETNILELHYDITSTRTNHKNLSKKVNQILENFKTKKDFTLIFLTLDTMTPSVKDALRTLIKKYKIYIQIFPIRTLMYNITHHKSVPKHERYTESEYSKWIKEFMEELHINTLDNLPKILDSDPVAMFIGLRPGELCKIIRPSLSAGKHTVWRYCVQT
tara:strand:- start:4039 stop:4611 length:573 start_codon:yes stop_codon:yes gene_type:complete